MGLTIGSKYEAGRDVAAVAKLLRTDIKEALRTRALPKGLKVSVKIDRFSMGCSLDVRVTEAEPSCFNPEFWVHLNSRQPVGDRPARFTVEGQEILTSLEALALAYQRADVDFMTDYHHTNFYLDVKFDGALENQALKAMGVAA